MKRARRAAVAAATAGLAAAALSFMTASAEAQVLRGRGGRPFWPAGGSVQRPNGSGYGNGVVVAPLGPLPAPLSANPAGSLAPPSSMPPLPRVPSSMLPLPTIPWTPVPTNPKSPVPDGLWGRRRYAPGQGYSWPGGSVVFFRPGQVIRLHDYGVTIFQGYSATCGPGYGYVSPFAIYNCPPFIGASSVLLSTPYVYAGVYASAARSARSAYAGTADDGYRDRTLRAALNDLSRFWEENDVRALRRRVSPDFAVAVFGGERHLYSLRQNDFLLLAADALDRVRTVSLRFDAVREQASGSVSATAVHVYHLRSEDGSAAPHVATLRYTLVYVDNDWCVSAVSLAPEIS